MGARPEPAFVGRVEELEQLHDALDPGRGGGVGTTVVSGDAGVGKTSLVRRACSVAAETGLTLEGACLPLTSLTVPYQALRVLVRHAMDRGIDAPSGMFDQTGSTLSVPVFFDAWLEQLCERSPVAMVVDDLHWADPGTLDVLLYVIASSGARRLTIVGTFRSGEVADGHALHRWLADVRRLPGFGEIALQPFDRAATGEQIASLLGGSAHETLVDEVFRNTRGNSYLNQLLVEGLHPAAQHLPSGFPTSLSEAVLRPWHGLSASARRLTGILATGGRPMSATELASFSAEYTGAGDLVGQLVEAHAHGLLDVELDGRYWFHHPLQAEELERHLPRAELTVWHRQFAVDAERRLAENVGDRLELAVAAADHRFGAGDRAAAYRAALSAADLADDRGAVSDRLRMLQRAVELRADVDASENLLDLLSSLRMAAARAGAAEIELSAIESVLSRTTPDASPLDTAELLVRRMHLRYLTGRGFIGADDMREAVRLSAIAPGSWQHALALAELAHACLWQEDEDGEALSLKAERIARKSSSERALSYALTARAMACINAGRTTEALRFSARAYSSAVASRDPFACVHSALWESNSIDTWSSPRSLDHVDIRRVELTAMGLPHPYIAWLSCSEAHGLLIRGRWSACQDLLRLALGSDPGALAAVSARLCAARLAALQGRVTEAQAHLSRADEIFAETTTFLSFQFEAVRAEVLLSAGQPDQALAAAMSGASTSTPPTMSEWLVPLAARAIADIAQEARDCGRDTSGVLAQLDDLVARFPGAIQDRPTTDFYAGQMTALNSLYTAEVGRARQAPSNAAAWIRAADALHLADLPWEEAYSCWRGAETQLLVGHTRAEGAVDLLRRGWDLAGQLRMHPVRAALTQLAGRARIPLDAPPSAPDGNSTITLSGLTPREKEIVEYVVLGRTYAEIARALVISEKTVSSHISNLLRKTGASNRLDLARMATRIRP